MTVVTYIARHIDACGKTQREIAAEAGFDNPNIISMFKNGITKVPLAKVSVLADAIGAPRQELLRICLAEYQPEIWEVIDDALPGALLAPWEAKLIKLVRDVLTP